MLSLCSVLTSCTSCCDLGYNKYNKPYYSWYIKGALSCVLQVMVTNFDKFIKPYYSWYIRGAMCGVLQVMVTNFNKYNIPY